MQSRRFQRREENFTCANCNRRVAGSGYTNHCPQCLWSKHVDVNPGDRAGTCGGMMEPSRIEGASPDYRIVHRCMRCGLVRRNLLQKGDNMHAVFDIAREQ